MSLPPVRLNSGAILRASPLGCCRPSGAFCAVGAFDADQWAFVGGLDYRVSDQAVIGGALSYGSSSVDFAADDGALDTDSISLSLYGSAYAAKNFYFDGIVNFSNSSYDGATTAEIAREAGVSEPILYRHVASKRELYFACLDEGSRRFRGAIEEALAAEPDASLWTLAMSRAARAFHERGECKPTSLWVQAINQAAEDPEIRKAIRRNLREIGRAHV